MRKRLLRGIAAGVLVVTIAGGGTAQAAPAVEAGRRMAAAQVSVVTFDWPGLVISVLGYLAGGGGGSNLDAALQQILAAVEAAKNDIINHADLIAAADVQACARSAAIDFSDIDTMSGSVRQLFAQRATECGTRATAYLGALVSPQAVDNIGYLVGPLFAIVIAARTKANLINGIALVQEDQIRSYQAVVAKLTPRETTTFTVPPPRCVSWFQYPDPSGFIADEYYTCTAHTGDTAQGVRQYWWPSMTPIGPPIDRVALQAEAIRNTSRPIAIEALPRLGGAPRPVM